MNGHLVTVEISVESGSDQRVKLDSAAFDQDWFEGLDTQAMQGRSPVEQYGTFFDTSSRTSQTSGRLRSIKRLAPFTLAA